MIRSPRRSLWNRGSALGIIAAAGIAAYANSFGGPFVFDGSATVMENASIRHLWPLTLALHPPTDGSPVSGRPLTNLTFALNYAAGGLHVWGYHAVNLGLHLLAAALLFGILRRSCFDGASALGDRAPPRDGLPGLGSGTFNRTAPAAAAALLWAVHPLQTESVTYVAQRSEVLMGLCYLGTLYAFIRAAEAPKKAGGWYALSCAVCLAGMAAKEVMVTAPVLVLLYDRTFLTESITTAWRRRRIYYSALAATWLPFAYLFFGSGTRGGTIGFATKVPWTAYGLMQIRAVTHYLRLCFWPGPLVIDYGTHVSGVSPLLLAEGLLLLILAMATALALWRRRPVGFLGAWFFVILAPTSSVVPVATEIIAEHRMYLPLAAVVTLVVVWVWQRLVERDLPALRSLGEGGRARWLGPRSGLNLAWLLLGAAAVGLIVVTFARNRDYRSARALWAQTVAAVPTNAGAHNNLAAALLAEDHWAEAADEFGEALRLDPSLAGAHQNLGRVRLKQDRPEAAIEQFAAAVRLAPTYPEARDGLAFAYFAWGSQLAGQRHLPEAIKALQTSVAIDPAHAEAQGNLGGALLNAGRPAEALGACQAALRLKPNLVEARLNLGNAFLELGKPQEAIAAYRQVIALQPDFAAAHHNLAAALHAIGQDDEARAELQRAH
jgi:tetratricopeptide (TPR) repeat protein